MTEIYTRRGAVRFNGSAVGKRFALEAASLRLFSVYVSEPGIHKRPAAKNFGRFFESKNSKSVEPPAGVPAGACTDTYYTERHDFDEMHWGCDVLPNLQSLAVVSSNSAQSIVETEEWRDVFKVSNYSRVMEYCAPSWMSERGGTPPTT
jgi:hypothetical protein